MKSILFVCLGNICRSPTAKAVFDHKLAGAGIELVTDSAGTGDWHIGHPPDPRSQAFALSWGVDMSEQRARQVRLEDFASFDRIYAMDRSNLAALRKMAPEEVGSRVDLVMSLAPDYGLDEVPDPYYGGDEGFQRVIDMLETAADRLIAELRAQRR
ncbi:low molecular weight protein-tyrosine-phosphatase [Wenzhouxiangella limi]|uniref:protein-tyrosine-phosphatase n=1 Tax=Wenzhouxiangella limi TaxID=2707351 RepID=A0A845UVU1_9GAMM|nr:low molecular weight protein-tyrosine-phosphatase [Wenzhouxiangella limi]NDY94654.1 low molecular weight phosphotyrosine protein phosphatase [Wenzhouxiangella limi]